MEAGYIEPLPAKALTYMLVGAMIEAGLFIAGADDPAAARREIGRTLARLLEGLRVD
jgi:hypothetical protein